MGLPSLGMFALSADGLARIINRDIFARIATYAEAVHEIPQKQEVGAQEFVTCGKRRETLRANDRIPKKKARRSRERQA